VIQFKKYVYKASIPLTIEAPTFRSKSRLDEFINQFITDFAKGVS